MEELREQLKILQESLNYDPDRSKKEYPAATIRKLLETKFCFACNDSGHVYKMCEECNGEGKVEADKTDRNDFEPFSVFEVCEECDGDGHVKVDCPICK